MRAGYSHVGWLYSQDYFKSQMPNNSFMTAAAANLGLSKRDLYDALIAALRVMPPTPQRNAIANALGYGNTEGKLLAARRREFAEMTAISERTLLRHEQVGAEQLIAVHDQLVLARNHAHAGDPHNMTHEALVDLVLELQERVGQLEKRMQRSDVLSG